MDNNLTVGSAIPIEGVSGKISHINLDTLINTIKSIDKRLENIEKLLLQIQHLSGEAGKEKTPENPE